MTDRLNVFRQEAQRLGIKVVPPDINRSEAFFACDADKNLIFYALAAVKGVGRQAMDHLVAVREEGGPFLSIGDFARRVDPKLINKRAFESLVRAGAFDCLSPQPPPACGVRRRNPQRIRAQSAAIVNPDNRRCSAKRRERATRCGFRRSTTGCRTNGCREEFSAIGFYLSGHPLDGYEASLKRLGAITIGALNDDRRRSSFKAVLAGTLIKKQERRGRTISLTAFSRCPIRPACSK